MKLIPNTFSMQINVPHSVYGRCGHMMPVELIDWIHEMLMLEDGQCVDYSLVGSQTSGNGFTDMVSNQEYIYVIRNLKEEDGLAFKMQFPKCKIYMYQQYD